MNFESLDVTTLSYANVHTTPRDIEPERVEIILPDAETFEFTDLLGILNDAGEGSEHFKQAKDGAWVWGCLCDEDEGSPNHHPLDDARCIYCGETLEEREEEARRDFADYCESAGEFEPMFTYGYPIDLRQNNHCTGNEQHAQEILYGLPLVIFRDGEEGPLMLGLTGGGMDMSWSICEAFMRLGCLPPSHFCDLPEFGGERTATECTIARGAEQTLLNERQRASQRFDRFVSKHLALLVEG